MAEPAPEPTPSPEPTIADPAPAPEPVEPMWREDWRQALAGDDQKEQERLARFNSPNDIYKSFRTMEQEFSKRQPRIEYKEGMDDAQLQKYREQEGVPKTAKDYSVEFESGLVIGDADKEQVTAFAEWAHEHNIPQSHFKSALEWYFTNNEAQNQNWQKQVSEGKTQTEQMLRAEWGGEFEGNINAMNELFVDTPDFRDIIAQALGPDGLPLGNNPEYLRWAASLGKRLNPTATMVLAGNESGESIDSQLAEARELMSTNRKLYEEKYVNSGLYDKLLEKQAYFKNRK